MFILFFFLLLIIIIMLFKNHSKEFISPAVLFVVPFFFLSIVALMNYNIWGLSSFNTLTFFVLIVGIFSFLFGTFAVSKIRFSCQTRALKISNSKIGCGFLFLSLLIELFGSVLYLILMLQWGNSRGLNLKEAINASMIATKFNTGGDFLDLPFFVNSLLLCGKAIALVLMPVFARQLLFHKRKLVFLLFLDIIIPILTTFLGGSRGDSLQFFASFIIILIFEFYLKYQWKRKLPFSVLICLFGFGVAIVASFFLLQGMVGRSDYENGNLWSSFSVYFGAQLKNLDVYLSEWQYHSSFFSFSTLSGVYSILNRYFGFNFVDSIPLLPYVFFNGYNLGNVYSCFYDYYIDGGLLGVLCFSFISGMIGQALFKKSKMTSDNFSSSVWLSIYGYAGSYLLFCFFGNRFFGNVFSASFLRIIIWMFAISIVCNKVSFNCKTESTRKMIARSF